MSSPGLPSRATRVMLSQESFVKPRNTTQQALGHIDDAEGAISAEELFAMVDKDSSGTITRDEFVRFHDDVKVSMKLEHKKEDRLAAEASQARHSSVAHKRRNRLLCWILGVLGVFAVLMILANTLLTYATVELSKETVVRGRQGVVTVQGSTSIAQTAEAVVQVPLVAAPMLPLELLDRLKTLKVTRDDGVHSRYSVSGYDWIGNLSMTFRLGTCGDKLELHDGAANLIAGGTIYGVCAADATCSAFRLEESELDVAPLLAAVDEALQAKGLGGRRRLPSWSSWSWSSSSSSSSSGSSCGGFSDTSDSSLCGNTCYYASDGDCDDGGPGNEYGICALGSDCYDCGPRNVNSPSPPPSPYSPPPSPAPLTPPLLDLGAFTLQEGGSCIKMKPQCINPTTRNIGTSPAPSSPGVSPSPIVEESWAGVNMFGDVTNTVPGLPLSIVNDITPFISQWEDRLTPGGVYDDSGFRLRVRATLFFADLLISRLMFAGTAHDAMAAATISPPVKSFLNAHIEPMVACYQKWHIYSCTGGAAWSDHVNPPSTYPAPPANWDSTTCTCTEPPADSTANSGRRAEAKRLEEGEAALRELLEREEESKKGDRRELIHAPMPTACSTASVGGGAGTGVEALGCFLWTIYGHYPFGDREFQEAFNIFGFNNIGRAAVQALSTTDKSALTSQLAGSFMQSASSITASSAATAWWNTPMTVGSSAAPIIHDPPPPPNIVNTNICGNSCNWNFDADCDDGGPGAEYQICSYGSDCYDCGNRVPTGMGGSTFVRRMEEEDEEEKEEEKEGEKDEEKGASVEERRRQMTTAPVTISRQEWVEGQFVVMHEYHPGIATDLASLHQYFDWACLYNSATTCGAANTNTLTDTLTQAQVTAALLQDCLYEPAIVCTSGLCPPNAAFASYPFCCTSGCTSGRRLEGRQLAHVQGNGMCHPATSHLARCEDAAPLRIDAAKVGDSIRTPSGCEPITGLFHADADAVGAYYKFSTKGGATVAISDGHWLFVNGVEADPATVKVGDRLTVASSGQQEPIVRVERGVAEKGAYHIMVASGAYHVDGVVASTYIAHVPLGVWKVFADGYASLRYKMGAPIAPEGEGYFSITWPLAVYDTLGVPSETALTTLWPLTTAAAVLTELANTLAVPALLIAAATFVATK